MDNAFVADGVIVLVLAAGALIGAKRGLVKSLMGVFVVVGALVGALLLADALTDPITDALSERIEEKVLGQVTEELGRLGDGSAQTDGAALRGLFEKYSIPTGLLDELLDSAVELVGGAASAVSEQAEQRLRGAVSVGVRGVVRSAVHAGLALGGFLVLAVVLSLLARVVDRVFDLPLLDVTNSVGGAILGLLEAGAVIVVLLFFASRFGVKAIMDCADGSRLMPYFLLRKSFDTLPTLGGSL